MVKQLSQTGFDRLSGEIFNKRIGNFLYLHEEANPPWHHFFDMEGNTVSHGGRGDSTDVKISIKPAHKDALVPLLITYIKELVGRHGGTLHSFGERKFHAVTILFPHRTFHSVNFEVTIHSLSDNQDEIAYEVMAALSGVLVYKAIAPVGSYRDFKRLDMPDDGKWVAYWHHRQGIKVTFNPSDCEPSVVVSKAIHQPREDWEKFKSLMYDFVDEYVFAMTGSRSIREKGFNKYPLIQEQGFPVSVDVDSGSTFCFAVNVPYKRTTRPFPRLVFAKEVMEMLSKAFPV